MKKFEQFTNGKKKWKQLINKSLTFLKHTDNPIDTSPLFLAVSTGCYEVVEYLLENGADIEIDILECAIERGFF